MIFRPRPFCLPIAALLTGLTLAVSPAVAKSGGGSSSGVLTPFQSSGSLEFKPVSQVGIDGFTGEHSDVSASQNDTNIMPQIAPLIGLEFKRVAPVWAGVTPSEFGVYSLLDPRADLIGARAHLRDLIASVEAGPQGYDAVQGQATIRPPKAPTTMTIEEVFTWIRETPGQHHAIGRYQVIPSTLAELVAALGLPPDAVYAPHLQDRLADHLIDAAGLPAFCSGAIGQADFQNRIARVWAGLPTTAGRSHYEGYAGNTAHMPAAQMAKALANAKALCLS